MVYQIREMLDSDWPQVSQIYREGMDTNLATFQSECPTWEEWDASHLKDCRLVIIEGGKVIGWTALTAVSGRCVYAGVAEVSIYISRDYRGRRIGKALLLEQIRLSEKKGFWTLQSGIMQDNQASICLHKSCGFRLVGYRERIGCDQFGVWRNTVLMEKHSTENCFNGPDTCGSACSGKDGKD